MSKLLIVDGNSVGHAAHRGRILSAAGVQTQAIYGTIRSLRNICIEYPDFPIIVLWDGRAQWRFDMHPQYKSNRDSDAKKVEERAHYSKAKPYIIRGLSALGIKQMLVSTHEADDMAGVLIGNMKRVDPDAEIVMISGDEDWIQLLRDKITWRDWRDDSRIVTLDNLMDKTGFRTPYGFLEGKALQGDTSDVIGGVGGIGAKGAPEFIAEFGSVREFWRLCSSGEFKPKKKAHLNLFSGEGRGLFVRNLKLMQLIKPVKPKREHITVYPSTFDQPAFRELCEELSFMSILRDMTNFIEPFKVRSAV